MKQLNLVLTICIFCLLYTLPSYSQANCTGGSRSASCYAIGTEQLANGAWLMTFPTGNLRYTLSAECGSTAYYSDAMVWGAVFSYVQATPQNPTAYDHQVITGLDPNVSSWIEVQTRTTGPSWAYASAYASVETW